MGFKVLDVKNVDKLKRLFPDKSIFELKEILPSNNLPSQQTFGLASFS